MTKRNIWAWILGTIGLFGVAIPHGLVLLGFDLDLNLISHPVAMEIFVVILLIAFILKK